MKINPPGGGRTLSKISVEPGAPGKRFFFRFRFFFNKDTFYGIQKGQLFGLSNPERICLCGQIIFHGCPAVRISGKIWHPAVIFISADIRGQLRPPKLLFRVTWLNVSF